MGEEKFLDLTDHGMTIPYESTPEQYRRAKAIAKEAGQTLTILPAKPKPWQPPEGSYCVRHDVSVEEYAAAKKAAAEKGLDVIVAPDGWSGPTIHTETNEEWTPPKNAIVCRHDCTFEEWSRAREAAERLGVECVLAPESVPMPARLPEKILPGLPIMIPRTSSTQEYGRLKAVAKERGVNYYIGE